MHIPRFTWLSMFLLITLPAQAGQQVAAPGADQVMSVNVGETTIPHTAGPPPLRNPYEGQSDAIAQGRSLFSAMNCIGCHAPEGGGGMGPPLSDNAWIYGDEPGQVYLSILQGRPNGMPAFSRALPPEAIWQLVSYVRSLSSDSPGKPADALPNAGQGGK